MKISIPSLESNMKRLTDVLERYIIEELADSFEKILAPKIINNIMNAYMSEISQYAPGYDSANPMNTSKINEFRAFLEEDIASTFKKDIRSRKISLAIGDKLDLGYDLSAGAREARLKLKNVKNPDLFYWLIFYLEGISGTYVFISKEDYAKLVAAGKKSKSSLDTFSEWGWFGDGFIISKSEFQKKYSGVSGLTPKIHPFSGKAPSLIFERALDGIDINSFFNDAVSVAIKRI